ncbi:MAG: hypothetical protein J0H49_30445 [Acidobacteria bacterium]|nr:hypothetical protein [Acidobacteriota bacterium]
MDGRWGGAGAWGGLRGRVSGFGWEAAESELEAAGVGLDPTGVAVEGLDEAGLTEDPWGGAGFVALAVFEAGVEEGAFAAGVEEGVAFHHLEFEGEGPALRVGDGAGGRFGEGAEVGFDARGHAVAGGVGSGAPGVGGGGGFAGGGAGSGGFAGVGAVGREALFGDLGSGHGLVLSCTVGVEAAVSSGGAVGPGGVRRRGRDGGASSVLPI